MSVLATETNDDDDARSLSYTVTLTAQRRLDSTLIYLSTLSCFLFLRNKEVGVEWGSMQISDQTLSNYIMVWSSEHTHNTEWIPKSCLSSGC